jgi:hypothetical protein
MIEQIGWGEGVLFPTAVGVIHIECLPAFPSAGLGCMQYAPTRRVSYHINQINQTKITVQTKTNAAFRRKAWRKARILPKNAYFCSL